MSREQAMTDERLRDLVRYARSFLFTENLISEEEYVALATDNDNGQRVARLEAYDALRAHLKDAIKECGVQKTEAERLRSRVDSLSEQLTEELVFHQRALQRIAALEAENRALREDRKRLDWLEAGGDLRRDFISAVAGAPAWWTKGPGPNYQRPHYRTAREAIDAAMREAQAAREYDRAG